MGAVETIELVLGSGVLTPSLIFVPARGATMEELRELTRGLPRPLSARHEALLKRWNGLNLEVLRIYGASPTPGELRGLLDTQGLSRNPAEGAVVFADDPSGFVYAEGRDERITAFDSSFGTGKIVASDIDDFLCRLVFGPDAAEFGGKRWLEDLKKAGII